VNPFELARTELFTPWDAGRVFAAIDGLLRDGFVEGDVRYRLFGGRIGRAFSMSHGLPLLGGGTPVLRGRVREGTGSTTLEVSVGARNELIVFGAFWGLLTVLGGGYQVLLQCRRVLVGEAGWGAVFEVLPGIAIMAAIVLFGVGWWRRSQRPQAEALVERLRLHLEASFTVGSAAPFAPGPIA
jgi:hypothetical protein